MIDIENIWKVSKEQYKIQQIKEEWAWLLSHLTPQSAILEIGCYDGGTTYSLSHFANMLVTVDLHNPARFDTEQIKKICKKYAYLGGDSHDPAIHTLLEGCLFDFIFIDGDHTYEGVKRDFEIYSKYAKPGSRIAFHDIVESPYHVSERCFVGKWWNEVKLRYKSEELTKDAKMEWGGIGIITYA